MSRVQGEESVRVFEGAHCHVHLDINHFEMSPRIPNGTVNLSSSQQRASNELLHEPATACFKENSSKLSPGEVKTAWGTCSEKEQLESGSWLQHQLAMTALASSLTPKPTLF